MDIEILNDLINVRWFIIKGLTYPNKFGARKKDNDSLKALITLYIVVCQKRLKLYIIQTIYF